VWVDLDDQWKTYEYPFCVFLAEGWGGSKQAVEPSKLFSFHFKSGAREQNELWLDDLAFYQTAKGAPAPRCAPPCPLEAAPRSARVEPAFSTAPLSDELTVHTFEQATRSCGGLTRRYLSYVPRGMRARSSAPVLIMLHGSSGNAESARTFQTHNRFEALAARDRFVVVYGNAASGPDTSPDPGFPNTGSWRHGLTGDNQVDDVDYLERVLGDLVVRGVLKGDNPVYLAGLSNGGGMVLEAARRIPHRIRGIAALMPYDGLRPEPARDLSGTKLRRALFAYSIGDPGLPDGYHRILAPLPGAWAATMGVPAAVIAAPSKTLLPDLTVEGQGYRGRNAVALSTRNSRVTELDMATADGGAQVRVLVMDHAGHFWPSPTPDTEDWILDTWGFRNQDFDAADMVWEYLRPTAE
jgi:poly(3-hydroxybutyrate) depolymerase